MYTAATADVVRTCCIAVEGREKTCDVLAKTVGGLPANVVVDHSIPVARCLIEECRRWIDEWLSVFPNDEDTFVQREMGVPSLLIRFDCVRSEAGTLGPYEIEDRPAGVGLSLFANGKDSVFAQRLSFLQDRWPPFRFLLSSSRREMDDAVWLERSNGDDDSLLLLRAAPDDTAVHRFEHRSVSTLRREGNKSYGVDLGWWHYVSHEDLDQLPWDEGFVLKPSQGTHSREVYIWYKAGRTKRSNGLATKTKIASVLRNSDPSSFCCQPFVRPMDSGIEGHSSMMYRIFFGFDPISCDWLCLGGCATARSNYKIHGATDSLFLPLKLL